MARRVAGWKLVCVATPLTLSSPATTSVATVEAPPSIQPATMPAPVAGAWPLAYGVMAGGGLPITFSSTGGVVVGQSNEPSTFAGDPSGSTSVPEPWALGLFASMLGMFAALRAKGRRAARR